MHVLFVPSWYPAQPSDILGSFFREQAFALRNRGMTVGVMTPAMRSLSTGARALWGPFGAREAIDDGLPTLRYHGVRAFPWSHSLNIRFWESSGLRAFERYRSLHGTPDLLHVHGTLFGIAWAYAIHRAHGIPFVVTEHSSEFALGQIRPQLVTYLAEALRSSARCFGVSSALCRQMAAMFPPERIGQAWSVMPNLVSSSFGGQTRPARRPDQRAFTFLNVAALHRNKGQHILLTALAQACRIDSTLHLRIAGAGPEAQRLEALVQQLGIESHVSLLGHRSREQVRQEMLDCDAFVLASSYETFGVVVVEALMSGRPVISTRCGGPEDIVIPDQDGLLVDRDDVAAMAGALLTMRAQHERFDGESIRHRCIGRFGEAAFASRHADAYASVLSTANDAPSS
jgi:teichuronic acid biosynthesis glycosyltransferase TuaC